jgi:hypothetical protein
MNILRAILKDNKILDDLGFALEQLTISTLSLYVWPLCQIVIRICNIQEFWRLASAKLSNNAIQYFSNSRIWA